MADLIPNTNMHVEAEPTTSPVQPSSQQAITAESSAMANGTKKDFSMNTEVKSLAELKEKAPEVYKQMMMGIAQNIVSKMHRNQERLKQMWREGRYQR